MERNAEIVAYFEDGILPPPERLPLRAVGESVSPQPAVSSMRSVVPALVAYLRILPAHEGMHPSTVQRLSLHPRWHRATRHLEAC